MHAILVRVSHITNINTSGCEVHDVAGSLAMLEQQVPQGAIAQRSGEVILCAMVGASMVTLPVAARSVSSTCLVQPTSSR